ncbi:hypothetical protein F2Q69_00019529 [Brassica cretica]|uniref:Uncharacterized protein n=1 Tax=Brassica cretica TaxID=69181 RepID=A0A8S9Q5U9_BRACR|nr:hypothetical protein F2Q69_00019529 [Brassica cretica]
MCSCAAFCLQCRTVRRRGFRSRRFSGDALKAVEEEGQYAGEDSEAADSPVTHSKRDHRSHLAAAESVRDDPFDLFSGASVPTVFEVRISAVLTRHGLREDAKG